MSDAYDHDFQPLVSKPVDRPYVTEVPTSKLAVTSLVFGILGLTALPMVGSIVAIATGHAALGQIRESGGRLEGRPLAKVGLGLGYFMIVLTLIAALVVLALFLLYGVASMETMPQMATPAPFVANDERGVKMVNEMGQPDYKLIEDHHLNNAEGEIIACYNAGKGVSNPELALLTTRQLVYLKDGRTSSFELKDVEAMKDDDEYRRSYTPNYFDINNYTMEIATRTGPRMRIIIQPKMEGPAFYQAILKAAKQAGATVSTQ